VLVLMAVAAGVVIVAITNSSQDDLEEQSPNLESRCTQTELHDPELAAANAKAQQGTVPPHFQSTDRRLEGSAPGCIPVCFWVEDFSGAGTYDGKIGAGEIEFERKQEGHIRVGEPNPDQVPENEYLSAGDEGIAMFKDPTTLAGNHLASRLGYREVTIGPNAFVSSLTDAKEVRVGPSQDDCHIYNSRGEIIG